MAETDPMTLNERRKYIHKIWGGIEIVPSKKRVCSLMKQSKLLACTPVPAGVLTSGLIRVSHVGLRSNLRDNIHM